MTLKDIRRSAVQAAILAFVTTKDPKSKKRDGGASILTPELNPDLRDDLVDLVADVLIWAKAQGLDAAYIARAGLGNTTACALAEDAAVEAALDLHKQAVETTLHGKVTGYVRWSAFYGRWIGETASGKPCSLNMLGISPKRVTACQIALDRATTGAELLSAMSDHGLNNVCGFRLV